MLLKFKPAVLCVFAVIMSQNLSISTSQFEKTSQLKYYIKVCQSIYSVASAAALGPVKWGSVLMPVP